MCEQLAQGSYLKAQGLESNERPSQSQVQCPNHYEATHVIRWMEFQRWVCGGNHHHHHHHNVTICQMTLDACFLVLQVLAASTTTYQVVLK